MSLDGNKSGTSVTTIKPGTYTATQTGATVDRAGYEIATVIFSLGTKTDGTHTPSIEESDDDSSWGAATALSGSLAALASNTDQRVGYTGSKRYIRAKVTITGSPSTGCAFGAIATLGDARTKPTS